MDIRMDWEAAVALVDERGWDGFIATFEKFAGFNLYRCGLDWYDSKQYACKIRGSHGDLLIMWN